MVSMGGVAAAAVREPVRLLDSWPSYGGRWRSAGGAAYLIGMSDDRPRLWTPHELAEYTGIPIRTSLTGGQSVRAAEVSGCRSSHSRRTTSATAMRMSRRSSHGGSWPRRIGRATDGAAEARARRTRQGDLHRRAERHSS